jgi:hypothetical protein
MSESYVRAKIAALFTILILSAATMLWLLWRFPLITAGVTLAVLTTLGVCARLARLTDSELAELQPPDLTHGRQGV